MDINFVIEPTHVIQRQLWECWGMGPTSYSLATGDILNFNKSQFPSCVPAPGLTVSGNYMLMPFPSIAGNLRPAWAWRWYTSGIGGVQSVTQNAAGVGMTPGLTVPLVFSGTGGAAGTLTVLTATTFSINLTNSGSYAATPTVTVTGTGGTPPTLTVGAVVTTVGQVAAGTNLSQEKAQFFIMGGEM